MNDASPTVVPPSWPVRARAVLELMRVANVFTAVADVWMGMILATGELPGVAAVGITAATALLYMAGMVLNDAFDFEIDASERPERPIPSGRISLRMAQMLGWFLLASGVAAGWWGALVAENILPGLAAMVLALLIVAYDGMFKKTLAGPAVMALCRAVNVLLGMSLAADWTSNGVAFNAPLIPPLAIGLYIFSLTWFARYEARVSPRWLLVGGASGVVLSMALLAAVPWIEPSPPRELVMRSHMWLMLWGVLMVSNLRRLVIAILQPRPRVVQWAVGQVIMSLIIIDAALVLGYGSVMWGLAIIALLAPATLLSQWFKVS